MPAPLPFCVAIWSTDPLCFSLRVLRSALSLPPSLLRAPPSSFSLPRLFRDLPHIAYGLHGTGRLHFSSESATLEGTHASMTVVRSLQRHAAVRCLPWR
jgi:hypothetical protein